MKEYKETNLELKSRADLLNQDLLVEKSITVKLVKEISAVTARCTEEFDALSLNYIEKVDSVKLDSAVSLFSLAVYLRLISMIA